MAPNLEALVREELRAPVAELVRKLIPELIAEQLNGHALSIDGVARTAARATPSEADSVKAAIAPVAPTAPERAEEEPRAAEATPERGEPSAGLTTCSACGETKPPEEFSPGHYACKVCRRVQERERARRKRAAEASEPEG